MLRCFCGLHRYLQRRVDGVTIMHTAVTQTEVNLPAQGTKIYRCLLSVADRWPNTIITLEIARGAQLHGKETAALMAVLAARGLVERLEERRGIVGGSIWRLSLSAAKLLKLTEA